jgi:DNA-binding GntR family transcriptional regulator
VFAFNDVKSEATMNQISVSDRAYVEVRDRILSRVYRPGHLLSSRDIASEFDCSTVTIGRVLQNLAKEGYLDQGARATGKVRQWTESELRDAIDMRAVILAFAADCCAKRTNRLALARLKSLSEVLRSLATPDRRLDVISDCLALFETELCMGTGVEGLSAALRNAFPPALVRRGILVANDISLDRRFCNFDRLVDLIANGRIAQGQASSCLEFDAIDAALLEDNCLASVDLPHKPNNVVPFRGREITYSQWATEMKHLPSTVTT